MSRAKLDLCNDAEILLFGDRLEMFYEILKQRYGYNLKDCEWQSKSVVWKPADPSSLPNSVYSRAILVSFFSL